MTPCGTVGYTAPEIVKDERYSKSVDMWALGCVLYTLLCGFPPFYDESIQTLTEKVAKGQYTFLSPWWDNISKSAKDLISHLLTVDPVRRYTIDEFLNHPWIRQTKEETTPAFDAPPTTVNLDKKEFIEPMEGIEATGMAENIPANIRAAMQAGTTPLTPGARAAEFRSPGNVSLREVFDVSYAVHRLEEERARHGKARGFGALNALDEEELEPVAEVDEDAPPEKRQTRARAGDDAMSEMQRDMQKTAISKGRQVPKVQQSASPARKAASKRAGGGFELNLEGATLLSRRGKGMDANTGVGADGAAKAASKALKVES
jgi:serine/threonine-protein kinase RCK2